MSLAVFNLSKLCSCRFASVAHCFSPTRRAYCPILFRRQSFRAPAVCLCRTATTDTDSNEVTKTRRVRWSPRYKKVSYRLKRKFPPVTEHHSDPSPSSVVADMLVSQERDNSGLHNVSLNAARTEIDEKLRELQELAEIQIRDIDLAVEMDDENTREEAIEKTEVCICCGIHL